MKSFSPLQSEDKEHSVKLKFASDESMKKVRRSTKFSMNNITTTKTQFLIGIFTLVVQAIYTLIIPMKNIFLIQWPIVKQDTLETRYLSPVAFNGNLSYDGEEVINVLKEATHLFFTDPNIYDRVIKDQSEFQFQELGNFLNPGQHELMGKFYAIFLQAVEYPAFKMTPSTVSVLINITSEISSKEEIYMPLQVTCPKEYATIRFLDCVRGDGSACQSNDEPMINNQNNSYSPKNVKIIEGLRNHILMSELIATYHQHFRTLLTSKIWKPMYEKVQVYKYRDEKGFLDMVQAKKNGLNLSYLLSKNISYTEMIKNNETIHYHSCLHTQNILSNMILPNFTALIIQDALLKSPYVDDFDIQDTVPSMPSSMEAQVNIIIQEPYYITHNSWTQSLTTKTKSLLGFKMSQIISSVSQYKRGISTSEIMGSSMQLLRIFSSAKQKIDFQEWNDINKTLSYFFSVFPSPDTGYKGFYPYGERNSGSFEKLKELTKAKVNHWKDEENLEKWNQKAFIGSFDIRGFNQRLSNASLPDEEVFKMNSTYEIFQRHFKFEPEYRRCIYPFVKLYIATFTREIMNQANSLIYQFLTRGHYAQSSLLESHYKNNEVQLEDASLNIKLLKYPSSKIDSYPMWKGEDWILVPLLYHSKNVFNQSYLLNRMSLNSKTLIKYIENLLDSATSGVIGFKNLPFKCLVPNEQVKIKNVQNAATRIIEYWYKITKDLLFHINDYYDDINKTANISFNPLSIDYQLLNISNGLTKKVYAQRPTPVTKSSKVMSIGLMKLVTSEYPPEYILKQIQENEVCYNVLETITLNMSVLCFYEVFNEREERTQYESLGLQKFLYSNWSMGIVLNFIALYISLKYILKLYSVYCVTQFRDISFSLAVQFDIQGIQVISFLEVCFMGLAAAPLLMSYHLAQDTDFILDSSIKDIRSRAFREAIVALSMTWFIRLGEALGAHMIYISSHNWWYLLWVTRSRNVLLVIIFVVRMLMKDPLHGTYDYGMNMLFITCALSVVLGMIIIFISLSFEPKHVKAANNKDDRTTSLTNLLQENRVNRNEYVALGYTSTYGWSLSGLLLEGWKFCKEKDQVLLVKGNYAILMSQETGIQNIQLLKKPLTDKAREKSSFHKKIH